MSNTDQQVQQLEALAAQDMFKKMSSTCFSKCVRRYEPDGDLSVGEGACLERCVNKYLDAYKLINGKFCRSFENDPTKSHFALLLFLQRT